MSVWPSKDPDAVLDYEYAIPLDTGDDVAAYTLTRLTGTVAIDDDGTLADDPETTNGQLVQAVSGIRLSGGADGETSVFRIEWETTGGREDDDVITLFVSSHEFEALELTGYAKPLPPHLKARYPAFAAVDAGTIQYWLTDAERPVTEDWTETDYATALMALAAHNMTLAGIGTDGAAVSGVPGGLTRMKSGSLDLGFSEDAANARATGSLQSTRYGQEYKALLDRNRSGPRVTPTGTVPPGYVAAGWP